jgi:hypothetical protein
MGKYAPLREFLAKQGREVVPIKFTELESVLGLRLPRSKRYPAWWSNNPSNNPMTKEWLAAGYRTESVDTSAGKLVFRRTEAASKTSPSPGKIPGRVRGEDRIPSRHPLFGCLQGALSWGDNDLTEPADPDWGLRSYGPEA